MINVTIMKTFFLCVLSSSRILELFRIENVILNHTQDCLTLNDKDVKVTEKEFIIVCSCHVHLDNLISGNLI